MVCGLLWLHDIKAVDVLFLHIGSAVHAACSSAEVGHTHAKAASNNSKLATQASMQ
jgi:hypothetical protein